MVHLSGPCSLPRRNLPGGFVPEVFIRNWSSFIRTGIGTFLGAFEGEEFVGGLGAILAPDINNGHITAVECFWYILPEHRGGGIRLLKAYEEVGQGVRRSPGWDDSPPLPQPRDHGRAL